MGEATVIIICYVQDNFSPTQHIIRLEFLAKALKLEGLAQRLMFCLVVDYKLVPNVLIRGMRDGASINEAALRQVMFFFPKLLDVVCFLHTTDNVGNQFQFQILDHFAHYWIGMFSHSYNV